MSEAEAKNKGGRPSLKTPELLKEFCRRIAQGRSVANVCKDEDMPQDRAIWSWLSDDEAFAQDYARAIQARAMAHADMISDVTFGVLSGKIPPDRGRVALDAMKWTASRLLPKVYGDRQQVDVDVQHTHTLHLDALRALSARRPGNETGYIEAQPIEKISNPSIYVERMGASDGASASYQVLDGSDVNGIGANRIDVNDLDPPGTPEGGGAASASATSTHTDGPENLTPTPAPTGAKKPCPRRKKIEEI